MPRLLRKPRGRDASLARNAEKPHAAARQRRNQHPSCVVARPENRHSGLFGGGSYRRSEL